MEHPLQRLLPNAARGSGRVALCQQQQCAAENCSVPAALTLSPAWIGCFSLEISTGGMNGECKQYH